MSRVSAFIFLAGLALVAMFASLPAGGTRATSPPAPPAVHTLVCPAPMPGPGDPTPTPPPTPHPTEFDVLLTFTFVNELGQSASDLHVCFDRGLGFASLSTNAPGCPTPIVTHGVRSREVDVVWSSACVDPVESVSITVATGGSALVGCSFWSLSGSPLNTCPTPEPTPTPTPCNESPLPTDACGLPTPTPTPTATPYPWCDVLPPLTPAPGCLGTPTPTPLPGTRLTFTNGTGISADGLHFFAAGPMFLGVSVVENAEGCAWANAGASRTGPDFVYEVNVLFSGECVDDGESVTLSLDCVRPEFGCGEASVLGNCVDWTVAGNVIGSPCPTPDCGGVPCCNGLPCPTPSPPVDVTVWTFPNDSGQAASDLHASFTWPFSARLVENAPGCPEPELTFPGSYPRNFFDADWGVPCVDAGESVKVEITSEPPALPRCFYWTLFGQPIASSSGGCRWSGDVNCSGAVDSADALGVLAIVAGFLIIQVVCAPADVDCDGDEDAVDALKILRYVARMPYTQHEPCPDIGLPVS